MIYPKIQTVFDRDPETKFKTLLEGQWARPEFNYLANAEWEFTEKVDGTNIRVIWDGERVRFAGRTDNAQVPGFLLEKLYELFQLEICKEVFTGPITLFGEGYGAKIQKVGKLYIPDGVGFILFDAFGGDASDGYWLTREHLNDFCEPFGIRVVPRVDYGSLWEAVERVRAGATSLLSDEAPMEGYVMRPTIELLDRRGRRVITKIKCKDFR